MFKNKNINLLMKKLKNVDNDLWNKIKIEKIDEQEILKNSLLIERYILEKNNNEGDYNIKILIENKKLYETIQLKDNEKNKLEKIKSNYVYPLISENHYKLRINKDFKKTENRNELSVLFKKILTNKFNKSGLWIYGNFGIGKTFSGICLLNKFAELDKKVAFFLFPELITKINSTINNYDASEKMINIIEKIKEIDIILFDDIGSEKSSSWFRDNFLFPLLNYRFENNKMTLFTSNISIKEYKNVINNLKNSNKKIEEISSNRIIQRLKDNVKELNLL